MQQQLRKQKIAVLSSDFKGEITKRDNDTRRQSPNLANCDEKVSHPMFY